MDNFTLNENNNCGHSGDLWTFVVWMGDTQMDDVWTGYTWTGECVDEW